jgi:hypothetical protein
MKLPYKYTAFFDASIASCKPVDFNSISTASIDNLRPLLPDGVDFDANADVLGTVFNAAVVNMFNRNGDGINTETARIYTPNFIHKPTNIEHDKAKIIGHIVNAGFSSYPESEVLSEEQIALMTDPFHITLAALVYKYANPAFAELIMRSTDPHDPLYKKVSASWEIGFASYDIAVGGDTIDTSTIVSDAEEIEVLSKSLRTSGGSGYTSDGVRVSRLIKGEIYPLGIGFTINPAADVEGLITGLASNKKKKIISQNSTTAVKNRKITPMDIEKAILELKTLLTEKKFSEESVASMTSTFTDAIKERDTEYKKELTKSADEKETLATEAKELKASVEKLTEEVKKSQETIAELQAGQAAEAAVVVYNERMETLDKDYELEDEDRAFLATDLKTVAATDEAFAAYTERLAVLWRGKSKEAKAKFEEEVEKRITAKLAQASDPTKSTTEKALADAKEAKAKALANSDSSTKDDNQPETMVEKFAEAFSEKNITIS